LVTTTLAQQATATAVGPLCFFTVAAGQHDRSVAGLPCLTTPFGGQRSWTAGGVDPALLARATPGTTATSPRATAALAAILLIIMLER
jgi:hypothetical protein